ILATDELDRLPDLPLVEWMADRELAALEPSLAAHARLAAALGVEFRLEEAKGVLHELEAEASAIGVPLDAKVGMRRLVASGLLESRGQGRVGFRHSLVREAIVRSTPANTRIALHRAASRFYKNARGLPAHEYLPRLAHHTARAGAEQEA